MFFCLYCVVEAVEAVENDEDLIRFDAAVSCVDVNFSCDIRLVAKGLHVWGSVKTKKKPLKTVKKNQNFVFLPCNHLTCVAGP